jgi:hypothetical protein
VYDLTFSNQHIRHDATGLEDQWLHSFARAHHAPPARGELHLAETGHSKCEGDRSAQGKK